MDGRRISGSILGGSSRFFSCPKPPDRLLYTSSNLFSGYRGFYTGVERLVRESLDLLPLSDEINNAWSFPTLPSLCAHAQHYISLFQIIKNSRALKLTVSYCSQVHALVINLCNIHFMYFIRVCALYCKQKKLLVFHPYLYIFPSQVPRSPRLCTKAGQTPRGRDVN